MKTQHDQPTIFRFNETNNFADNCEAFLTWIETVDPEMASILRHNWASLIAIVNEGNRDSKARSEFNAAVETMLDAIVSQESQKDGAS